MLRAHETRTSQAHTQKGNLSVCNSECGHHSSRSICDPEARQQPEAFREHEPRVWPRRVTECQSAKDRAKAVTLNDMKYNRRRLDVVAHSQTPDGAC